MRASIQDVPLFEIVLLLESLRYLDLDVVKYSYFDYRQFIEIIIFNIQFYKTYKKVIQAKVSQTTKAKQQVVYLKSKSIAKKSGAITLVEAKVKYILIISKKKGDLLGIFYETNKFTSNLANSYQIGCVRIFLE